MLSRVLVPLLGWLAVCWAERGAVKGVPGSSSLSAPIREDLGVGPGELGEMEEERHLPECKPIIVKYALNGYDELPAACEGRDGTEDVFWVSPSCLSFPEAQRYCADGGGKLASFPRLQDRAFGGLFLNELAGGKGWMNGKCLPLSMRNADWPYVMAATWLGLAKEEGGDWRWEDGSRVHDAEAKLPWNPYAAYFKHTPVMGGSGCAAQMRSSLFASPLGCSVHAAGYVDVDCAYKLRALCHVDKQGVQYRRSAHLV